jgi:hypothetical protein
MTKEEEVKKKKKPEEEETEFVRNLLSSPNSPCSNRSSAPLLPYYHESHRERQRVREPQASFAPSIRPHRQELPWKDLRADLFVRDFYYQV